MTTKNLINIFDNLIYETDHLITSNSSQNSLPVNIYESKDEYKIEIPLNGLDPTNIKVNLKNNVLSIRHEETETEKEKQVAKNNLQLSHQEFVKNKKAHRTIKLKSEIKKDSVKAKNINGLLVISLKKLIDDGTVIDIE